MSNKKGYNDLCIMHWILGMHIFCYGAATTEATSKQAERTSKQAWVGGRAEPVESPLRVQTLPLCQHVANPIGSKNGGVKICK